MEILRIDLLLSPSLVAISTIQVCYIGATPLHCLPSPVHIGELTTRRHHAYGIAIRYFAYGVAIRRHHACNAAMRRHYACNAAMRRHYAFNAAIRRHHHAFNAATTTRLTLPYAAMHAALSISC